VFVYKRYFSKATVVSDRVPNDSTVFVHHRCMDNGNAGTVHGRRVRLSHRTARLQIRHTRGMALTVYYVSLRIERRLVWP